MKKNYFLIAVALVAALFVGCEQADDCFEPNTPPTPPTEEVKMQHIVATLSDPNADTRIAIHPDANNQVWSYEWEEGDMVLGFPYSSLTPDFMDMVRIFENYAFVELPVTVDENGVATIEGDVPVGYMQFVAMSMGDILDQEQSVADLLGSYADGQLNLFSDVFEIEEGVSVVSKTIEMHHITPVVDINLSLNGVSSVEIDSIDVCGIGIDDDSFSALSYMGFASDGTMNFGDDSYSHSASLGFTTIHFSDGSLVVNGGESVNIPFAVLPFILEGQVTMVYHLADGTMAKTQININGKHEIKRGLHYTFNSIINQDSFISSDQYTDAYEFSSFIFEDGGTPFIPTDSDVWTIVGDETVVLELDFDCVDDRDCAHGVENSVRQASDDGRSITLKFPMTESFMGASDSRFYKWQVSSLSLPNAFIDQGVLTEFPYLQSIEVDPDRYCQEDGVLFNVDKTQLHTFLPWNNSSVYVAPESVTSIGESAFGSNCGELTEVTFPNVTYVSANAFDAAGYTINLPEATYIGTSAFSSGADNRTNMEQVYLPKAVYLDFMAFQMCNSLESLDLPSVEYVGLRAFADCSDMVSVNLPKATFIGDGAFQGCRYLSNIVVNEDYYTFEDGVLYDKDKTLLHTFASANPATSFTAPESVVSIGSSAFDQCENLTSVTIPNISVLESQAFAYCGNLIEIDLPNVSEIYSEAFRRCDDLLELRVATNPGVKLVSVSANSTFHGNFTGNVTLTLGAANADSELVDGKYLTLSDGSTVKFKDIIILPE